MKRFLVFVIICIVTLSLGLTTYYFLRDNEVILVTDSYFELNLLETFTVNVEHINKDPNTKINFESLHPNIVEYNPVTEMFETKAGGRAIVRVTSNKADFKPVAIEVVVGDGTSNSPFFIKSIEDLLFIGKEVVYNRANVARPNVQTFDKHYKLRADLDFSTLNTLDPVLMANNSISTTIYQNGIWLPIGYNAAAGEGFKGTFNFDNHVISNLTINENNFSQGVTVNNAGLFAVLELEAKVSNLNLRNVNIEGSFVTVGAVAGTNHGIIERVSVESGSITNTNLVGYAGGIVGKQEVLDNIKPYTEMVFSNASVNATYVAGGLVGQNLGGVVVSAYSNANIIGEVNTVIGGIVGLNQHKDLGASTYDAVIKDTYYYGTITSASEFSGAIIGQNINKNEATELNRIRGNYYSTELSGDIQAIGGLLNSEIDTNKIGVYSRTLSQLRQQANYFSYNFSQAGDENVNVYWSFSKTWVLDANINNGLPVLNMASPKINHNLALITDGSAITELQHLINIQNDMSGHYVLKKDLDLSLMTNDWIPLGFNALGDNTQFTGSFRADFNAETQQYYTIKNLFVQNNRSVTGLFAHIGSQGVIENLRIENVNIPLGQTTGTVAAINDGLIENASVISNNSTHFITANNNAGVSNVGGVVGINNGTIKDSYTSLRIDVNATTGRQGNGGGVAGINNSIILNTVSESTLYGIGVNSKYIGGITGYNVGSLEKVSHNGNITASVDADKIFIGGIAGYLDIYGTIKYSFIPDGNYQGHNVGGLVGVSRGIVEESYVDGLKIKARLAGGLVFNLSEGTFRNTYTLAYIMGIDKNSIKAGFAYFIEYHSRNVYGKIEHSFSAITFDPIGSNYAETFAPVRTEFRGLVPRQAGYIVKCIYHPLGQNLIEQNFVSAFNTEFLIPESDRQIKVTENQAIATDGNKHKVFKDAGFNTAIWQYTLGYYPTLIYFNVIEEVVEEIIEE